MTEQPTFLYVVADGAHARLIQRAGAAFAALTAFSSADAHRDSSDLGSDRPGHGHESVGTARHAIEPRHDLHDLAKLAFAGEVADKIRELARDAGFDRLVLVAPTHTLQEIERQLGSALAAKVAGRCAKDLVKLPELELRGRLMDIELSH